MLLCSYLCILLNTIAIIPLPCVHYTVHYNITWQKKSALLKTDNVSNKQPTTLHDIYGHLASMLIIYGEKASTLHPQTPHTVRDRHHRQHNIRDKVQRIMCILWLYHDSAFPCFKHHIAVRNTGWPRKKTSRTFAWRYATE